MKKLIIIVFCLGLVSCASKPKVKRVRTVSLRAKKIACVEKFVDKGIDALKGKEVCNWVFSRK